MNAQIDQSLSPWRYLWLIALIGLPVLGWHGVLDEVSSNGIDESLKNAGLVYGTARGINALVSSIQGTELNLWVITLSIGEVLDPVNDLVERFSEVVLIALGSLALQKILLALVSEKLFNIILSAAAAVLAVSLFFGKAQLVGTTLRLFMIITFFRFSLALVVLGNSWVDATFLHDADQRRHEAMENFQGELRSISELSEEANEAAAVLASTEKQLSQFQIDAYNQKQSIQSINTTMEGLDNVLSGQSKQDGRLCQASVYGPIISPTCSDLTKNTYVLLENYASKKENMLSVLESIEEKVDEKRAEVECIKNQMRGKKCGLLAMLPGIPDFPSLSDIQDKISEIESRVGDFAETSINLLASLLLKSIAIPLLFFYVLLKIIRTSWAKL